MAHSKFSLDSRAFEDSTRQVIQPKHVMPLQEEAGIDTRLFQTPPGSPAPEDNGEQVGDTLESSLLNCIMEETSDHLHAFQEYERYAFGVNLGSDCDVPEDEFPDEMEDIFSDEDQLVPVNLQEGEGPTEGDHGQQSPGNIPVDNTIAIEETIEPSMVNLHVTLVNVQVTEHEDPSTLRHLDGMEDIDAIEEDQLVPMNSQEAKHFTEDDHDQSSPIIIPVKDMYSEGDELIPANLQEEEEDFTVQGDHDQPNPVIIPSEDIEGNETSPANLHGTLVNVQGTEPEDPSTPRRLDFNIATIDRVYREADQVISENQLDVKVQTVTTTSAAEGESSTSSSSNLVLMDIHMDTKSPGSEVIYRTSMKPLRKCAIEAGAQEI